MKMMTHVEIAQYNPVDVLNMMDKFNPDMTGCGDNRRPIIYKENLRTVTDFCFHFYTMNSKQISIHKPPLTFIKNHDTPTD